MKYKDLLEILKKATPEQLQDDVAIHVLPVDEYFGVGTVSVKVAGKANGVLDKDHIYIELDENGGY